MRERSFSRPDIRNVIAGRVSRRGFLLGSGTTLGAVAAQGFVGSLFSGQAVAQTVQSSLMFTELARVNDDTHHVAEGYAAQVVVGWGDPMKAGQEVIDVAGLDAGAQAERFGYNCDFIAFMPLPKGSQASDHGLLCVNNEYVSFNVMFPGLPDDGEGGAKMTAEQVALCNMAIGHSIVEVKRSGGGWAVVQDSPHNRRFTLETPFAISGPVAGHDWMKTSYDPEGRMVRGTNYNCGGGVTPWGTVLTCEEGAADTFGGDIATTPFADVLERYGFDGSDYYGRARFDSRFDLGVEPNEPNRFDWVVEIDPYDPAAMPVKRTALGRMAHEAATVVVNRDGHVVVYMGDDANFEYVYRFVSEAVYDPADLATGRDILDAGTLSVARFNEDGTLDWLPLVQGGGPLTEGNGFATQADVLLKTRIAADLLGATPMDRPEDIETNPMSGRVYAVMTKNKKRAADKLNPVNTRPENFWGHIVEMIPPGGTGAEADHAAARYGWDLLVMAGDPSDPATGAMFNPSTSENGWFVTPDNITFDAKGRIFVATDGANDFGLADGIYGMDTEGPARGLPKLLFACPAGAEATGPCFTPDGTTLFVSVQHPGENSETLETATTRWPDFRGDNPPRPAIVAITRLDGGEVAS
jgi:secreted PhoX family phosphatase